MLLAALNIFHWVSIVSAVTYLPPPCVLLSSRVPRRGFEDAGCNGADKQQKDDVAGASLTVGTAQNAVTADSTLLSTAKKQSNASDSTI